MISGVIVLAHRPVPETVRVAEWYAERLRERGRKNVRIAYHGGEPYSDDVLREMNSEGINTVVILPLLVAEGDLSVWSMPKRIGMPDNSCS